MIQAIAVMDLLARAGLGETAIDFWWSRPRPTLDGLSPREYIRQRGDGHGGRLLELARLELIFVEGADPHAGGPAPGPLEGRELTPYTVARQGGRDEAIAC